VIQSYPWYIADWRESETRISLSLAERGLYRELLDYCYLEGSLPSNEVTLAKLSCSTTQEFKQTWPNVAHLFERDGDRLIHRKVNEVRAKLAAYHEQKKHAGAVSGRTRRERSLNGRSNETATELEPSPTPTPAPSPAPATAPVNGASKPPTAAPIPAKSEYPETAAAIRAKHPAADDLFVVRLVQTTIQAVLSADLDPSEVEDSDIAEAVEESHKTWASKKPHGSGLLLNRVPQIVVNWLREPPAPSGPHLYDTPEFRRNYKITHGVDYDPKRPQ
jgi:uncharacterized protein YdaU (DUF1376 family)